MLPWDYNLAFGRFSMTEDATFITNYGIDSPLYKAKESKRPMWNVIITNKEYIDKYHKIMDELLTNYFESGEYDKKINEMYALIKPYIKQDPSVFYSAKQVEQGVDTLKRFSEIRTQSVRKQLNGNLSTNKMIKIK